MVALNRLKIPIVTVGRMEVFSYRSHSMKSESKAAKTKVDQATSYLVSMECYFILFQDFYKRFLAAARISENNAQ